MFATFQTYLLNTELSNFNPAPARSIKPAHHVTENGQKALPAACKKLLHQELREGALKV